MEFQKMNISKSLTAKNVEIKKNQTKEKGKTGNFAIKSAAFTVLLLWARWVEWARRSMIADEHCVPVGQVLSLYAPSFAISHDDFETKPAWNKIFTELVTILDAI